MPGPADAAPTPGAASLRPLAGPPAALARLVAGWLEAEDPAPVVVRTSGSTGRRKDVVLSRRAVLASARATHERLGGPGRWLSTLPPHYVAGLQVLVRSLDAGLAPYDVGPAVDGDGTAALAGAVSAFAAAPAPRRYASLVPTQLHRLAAAGSLEVLAGLDAVLVGGAAMPPRLARTCAAAGVPVVRTYGMSETCGGCVYDGVPLDGVAVRVDAAGGVHLAGPVLFDGYADDPGRTAAALRDGWFATDDLGELDDDGRLRVLGRADDVVVSGGVNVALPAVAAVVRDLPGVAQAEVLGVDDEEWGARVVAFVVPVDGAVAPPVRSVRDALAAAGHPRSWGPRQVVALPALPLLESGKPDRTTLRALATTPPPPR